jgi:hypothetical protein
MKICRIQTLFVPVLVTGLVALTLALGPATVSASSERNGRLHVIKECSEYTGLPGSFCTITYSNLAAIPVGSKVLYDQAPGIPAGVLDSNVVLDAGNGNRAVGRCTLDLLTNLGLCTFSDGTGVFAGFHARVAVSSAGSVNYHWRGTYGFAETW